MSIFLPSAGVTQNERQTSLRYAVNYSLGRWACLDGMPKNQYKNYYEMPEKYKDRSATIGVLAPVMQGSDVGNIAGKG